MERSQPERASDMVSVLTELAVGVDGRPSGSAVLDLTLAQPSNGGAGQSFV